MATVILYDSTKKMPLENYKNYLETQDIKYFSSNLKQHKGIEQAMMDFFNDFIIVSENSQIIDKFSKIHKIEKLKGKYNVVMLLISAIHNHNGSREKLLELTEQLVKWGYKIDAKKELFSQLEIILNRIQAIKTQIQLLQSEFEESEKTEGHNIESNLDNIENVLEKKYKMNISDYTVYEYIMLQKKAENIIESRKNKK